MSENTPQIRRNLGRNLVKPSRVRMNTMLLRHLKKAEERPSIYHSLRTVGLGILAVAWSFAVAIVAQFIGSLGAHYGRNIVTTRALEHHVSMEAAMAITGGFGLLWLVGAVLLAWAITCLVALCFIPKRSFQLSLFGYYWEEDGQDMSDELFGSAVVALIYTAVLVAVNFAVMGLLTDMVHVFGL